MGQQITAKRRPFAGARQGESVTVTDPWGLVTDATKTLHAVMGRYRRHRWAALGLDRSPTVVRESRMWHRVLWEGRTSGLSCAIRADWLGADSAPMISVDFYSGEGRARRLTVRVGLRGEGRLATLALRAPRALPLALRQRWLKAARRAGRRRSHARLWWIDATGRDRTPEDLTRFVFLLYLWDAGLLKPDPASPKDAIWQFASEFVRERTRRRVPPARRTNLGTASLTNDGDLWLTLDGMRRSFNLPQHWKSARKYLAKVFRTLRAPERRSSREILVAEVPDHSRRRRGVWRDPAANTLQTYEPTVPKRTWYRWRSRGDTREQITARARERDLRRMIRNLLEARGRSREAARKLIYRRLAAGISLESLAARLHRRGRA